MYKKILYSIILFLSITSIDCNSPTKDVTETLRHVCTGKFAGSSCPYAIAYDIATQLASSWHNQDGSVGLWSDGSYRLWWPSGVGLWSYAEFLHTMKGRTTDKLYLPLRWAAIQTAKNKNNYKHTNYTDDQAWWANGAIRLEQYIRSIGDATVELVNASQAVIDDNIAHETNDCDGGILWYYGTPPPDDKYKATISNLLTIYLMATMYSITHDPALLHGGAIDIYDWLVSTGLVDPFTGDQKDGMSIDSCRAGGASYTYEYGVLVQGLMALADATGNQTYIEHAMTYIQNAFRKFTKDNIIYEECDESNTCSGDGIAFRGVLYLGLARLYERTRDDRIAQVIEASYFAMLTHTVDGRYPLSLINNNNNFTGDNEIVITIGDLNLATAMIKVYQYKYAASVIPNIDAAINGLLPFDATIQGLTGCVCNDIGCPMGHDMECFNDSGHKDPSGGHQWAEKVSAILVGPGHQMMLFKPKGTGHSDWINGSEWFIGDEYNHNVDSISIDY